MAPPRKHNFICTHQLISSECPDCRRARSNAAQRRHAKRYGQWCRLAMLIADVIGPLPDAEWQALMEHAFGGPLRPPHPNARTCEHGLRPMCDDCRRRRHNLLSLRSRKRKRRQGQSEGGWEDEYAPPT